MEGSTGFLVLKCILKLQPMLVRVEERSSQWASGPDCPLIAVWSWLRPPSLALRFPIC